MKDRLIIFIQIHGEADKLDACKDKCAFYLGNDCEGLNSASKLERIIFLGLFITFLGLFITFLGLICLLGILFLTILF